MPLQTANMQKGNNNWVMTQLYRKEPKDWFRLHQESDLNPLRTRFVIDHLSVCPFLVCVSEYRE